MSTRKKLKISQVLQVLQIPRRFYCHWKLPNDEIQYDEKGKERINDKDGLCCFNHFVGLPTRKWETDENTTEVIIVELTGFNERSIKNHIKHRKYSKNKCRGDGTTELITVRWNIFKYGVMNTVPNRKAAIIPGTSSKLALEISKRIKEICDRIPQIYRNGIPNSNAPMRFEFKTRGAIQLTSTVADAVRGHENIGDINEEEYAHWDMVNDSGVHYAAEGVHNKTKCHISHNTTPKGKGNSYWELVWSPDANSDYYKHVVNWREVVGLPVQRIEDLYDEEYIDDTKLAELRKELIKRYKTDKEYQNWYETFEKHGVKVFWDNDELIPIETYCTVPIPLLDINSIVRDAQEDRSHYDQELDNEFISTDNRAIHDIPEDENITEDNLAMMIKSYDIQIAEQQKHVNSEEFNKNKFDEDKFE